MAPTTDIKADVDFGRDVPILLQKSVDDRFEQ
jgi:hypothetical protein